MIPRRAAPEWIGAGLCALFAAALAWRLTIGVDLSDESYYAIFLDDWLKQGIDASTFLTLHQTAALLVYPFARLYVALRGSEDGLILFLRFLYLVGAMIAAGSLFALARRLSTPRVAWAAALMTLAFIPFGLPAPSYNTIAMQALLTGLAALGCGLMDAPGGRVWLLFSATAFAVMTVAYPPLALMLPVLGLALVFARPARLVWYALLALSAQALVWAGVIVCLGWDRLLASSYFLSAFNDVGSPLRQLEGLLLGLQAHPWLAALCVASALAAWLPVSLASGAMVVIVLAAAPWAQDRFMGSHDIVGLLALSGLGLLGGFLRGAALRARILAILYLTSMAAGLITVFFAVNGLVNFCIGGFPAAVFGTAFSSRRGGEGTLAIRSALAAFALLGLSLTYYYGDAPGVPQARQRISGGVFAGLAAQPGQIALLELMRTHAAPLAQSDIAVFGRYPGLILVTGARTTMPIPYMTGAQTGPLGLAMTRAFYMRHPPALIADYRDDDLQSINPIGPAFARLYRPSGRFRAPHGELEIFLRRN